MLLLFFGCVLCRVLFEASNVIITCMFPEYILTTFEKYIYTVVWWAQIVLKVDVKIYLKYPFDLRFSLEEWAVGPAPFTWVAHFFSTQLE